MDVKTVARSQYSTIVDRAAKQIHGNTRIPPEGWITTVRKALGMSGAQLARRMGNTRARVAQAERAERNGGVTLKSMEAFAAAMGCKFYYAIIPEGKIEDIVTEQARKKAQAIVQRASRHMALEDQALSDRQNAEEVKRLTQQLLGQMSSDFWQDP